MISHFIYSCWILGYLVQKSCLILGFLNLNLLQKSCLIWLSNLQIWLISAKSRHWTQSILLEKLEPIAKPAEWSASVLSSNRSSANELLERCSSKNFLACEETKLWFCVESKLIIMNLSQILIHELWQNYEYDCNEAASTKTSHTRLRIFLEAWATPTNSWG